MRLSRISMCEPAPSDADAGAVVDAEVVADLEADDLDLAPVRRSGSCRSPATPVPSRTGCSPGQASSVIGAPGVAAARERRASRSTASGSARTRTVSPAAAASSAAWMAVKSPPVGATTSTAACPGPATSAREQRGRRRRLAGSRDDALLLERADRLPVVAQLEQDLLGVLAALGRRRRPAPRRCRRSRPASRPCAPCRPRRPARRPSTPAASACGSATTSVVVCTGAHHMPARSKRLAPLGERAGGEDRVEQRRPARRTFSRRARMVAKRGSSSHSGRSMARTRSGQCRWPCRPSSQNQLLVLGAIGADDRVRGPRARHRRGLDAEAQRGVGVPPEHVDADAQQRRADELAAAGARARQERGGDAARQRHAGGVVAHGAALERRIAARAASARRRCRRATRRRRRRTTGASASGPRSP